MEIKITPTVCLFFNEETFFFIYGCNVNPEDIDLVKLNSYGNISIKGSMPKLEIGREYKVELKEDKNGRYVGSYEVVRLIQEKPETVEEQKEFLGMVLTPLQVSNIYEVYSEKDDVVGMIERGEFDYKNVKGIGDKLFEKLRKKVLESVDMSELLTFLGKHGIKYNMVAKLIKEYGSPLIVIQKLESNPYILTEVKGVGFIKADTLAKAMGFDMDSPERIEACIMYCIQEENQNGHSYVNLKTLLNKTVDLLNIDKSLIIDVLENPKSRLIIKTDDDRYTLKPVYQSEINIAKKMIELKSVNNKVFETEELDKMIDEYCENNNVELEENQRKFFHDWNENNILMLIGNAGMGKSFLVGILLNFIGKKSLTTALLTPTGKSAKVLSGYTGKVAQTIHRKIRVFEDSEEFVNIEEDIIVVDESSMCDVFILSKLFTAISNPNARVLFIGDDEQLLSVSVGRFLYDVIESGVVKVSRLQKVFRQKDGGILDVATDTRNNKSFLNNNADGRIVFGRDCVFWMVDSKYIKDGIISNYKKLLKRYSQDEVIVLSPTNKGKLGTMAINKELQKIANPESPNKKQKEVGKKDDPTIFRVGDMIMNLVNTYEIETVEGGLADIYNGDTGTIVDINEEEKIFVLSIDGINVKMEFKNVMTNLVHAWSMSIHKSQGSGYKVVIMVIDKSMSFQLNRNLLYTGLTRAKEYMLVLGQPQPINRAIQKSANFERRSFLLEFLDKFDSNNMKDLLDV